MEEDYKSIILNKGTITNFTIKWISINTIQLLKPHKLSWHDKKHRGITEIRSYAVNKGFVENMHLVSYSYSTVEYFQLKHTEI